LRLHFQDTRASAAFALSLKDHALVRIALRNTRLTTSTAAEFDGASNREAVTAGGTGSD
jgi:hypothetical protein